MENRPWPLCITTKGIFRILFLISTRIFCPAVLKYPEIAAGAKAAKELIAPVLNMPLTKLFVDINFVPCFFAK